MQKSNEVAVTVLTGGSVTYQFELPFPSKNLSPNARHHWSTAAKAKKAYRTRCRQLGNAAGLESAPKAFKAVLIHLTFVPPDKRRRDLDNLLASMKAGLDGVADAMGIDDSKWKLAIEMADDPVEGGRVLVEVEVLA
jgi:crossover junction endodeoxyribonuclease RusA